MLSDAPRKELIPLTQFGRLQANCKLQRHSKTQLSLIPAKKEAAGQSCHDPINYNLWLLIWSSSTHFPEARFLDNERFSARTSSALD